jgi:hypothetical protein
MLVNRKFCPHFDKFYIDLSTFILYLNRFIYNFQGFFSYGRKQKIWPSFSTTKNPQDVGYPVDHLGPYTDRRNI